ncbi:MAG: hypothetical protein PHZ00_01350 [Candidatus Peribacteraceae bacterium]|nr:hypothetical protein [Candidatus Peribacteraceae bacterium]
MIEQIISAFVLGLIGGLVPGPVQTAAITEVLQSGIRKSMRVILWAMLTETIVALLSLMLLSSLGFSETIFRFVSFVGAGILLWIAKDIWKVRTLNTGERVHFSLGKISAMILANGVLWTFWITVCVPKAIVLGQEIPFGQFVFLLAVEIGWLMSNIIVVWIFSAFRSILSHPRFIPFLFKFFALVFVYFAVSMTYDSVMFFLNH